MKHVASAIVLSVLGLVLTEAQGDDLTRWQEQARNVSIVRDTWGVPHVFGNTDADAAFGLLYAQAEDDFNRVEMNYVNALGRLAEIEGEAELYRDLRMKLFIDPADLQAKYATCEPWLRSLMVAFADGLNFYLQTHPKVKPRLLTHFEPWMALAFSEGSIGGDIETISLPQLEKFYGHVPADKVVSVDDPAEFHARGSNGMAISPALTAGGHPLLLINPHTSFYFRPEVHVISKEGLNAYGAVTWGQFFVYQGFNERVGWMHTSNGGDAIDEYEETVSRQPAGLCYKYGTEQRPLTSKLIHLPYKTSAGRAEKTVTVYYSQHGPIVKESGGKWISVKLMQEPVKALTQSFQRTKAHRYTEFLKIMDLRTNTSNNTVYADVDGNIAYFHGNFVPIRDPQFDWTKPVDGSNPATEWKGLHEVKDTISLFNPVNGWIQNTNNWPFSAAGPNSPRREAYPAYMWTTGENARGLHAVRLLSQAKSLTLDSLVALAFDPTLNGFEPLIPALVRDFDALSPEDVLRKELQGPIDVLRHWDFRSSVDSIPTTLAVLWGRELIKNSSSPLASTKSLKAIEYLAKETTPGTRLQSLAQVVKKLQSDFGTWEVRWGEINRFQRIVVEGKNVFDDDQPSLPVGFAPSEWGSLAAFNSSDAVKTKKRYGVVGNSFVAVVEFGPRIKAKSVLHGGVSGDPASPHFSDQALRYTKGELKDVVFYPEDIAQHTERSYHPGENLAP